MARITSENLKARVHTAFQLSRDIHGYPVPFYVAGQLTSQDHPLHTQIQHEIYHHPTEPFFFLGSRFTIKQLLRMCDSVAIWTDEYPERVNSSGLRGLQKYGDLSFILGEKKEDIIPNLFLHARERGADELIVMDDQLAKLHAVQSYAQEYPDISLHLVLVGQHKEKRREEIAPEITEISRIWGIRRIARRLANEKRLWVFDFNDTLVDRIAFEQTVERRVHRLMRRRNTS